MAEQSLTPLQFIPVRIYPGPVDQTMALTIMLLISVELINVCGLYTFIMSIYIYRITLLHL